MKLDVCVKGCIATEASEAEAASEGLLRLIAMDGHVRFQPLATQEWLESKLYSDEGLFIKLAKCLNYH